MNKMSVFAPAHVLSLLAMSSLFGCATTTNEERASLGDPQSAQQTTSHADQHEMTLPPGWTMEDMQACTVAGTPGKMHEYLADGVGTWTGKSKMWMAPGTEAMTSQCTSKITSILDG